MAAQLEQQLLNQHDIWKENKQIEGNCDRAVQFWRAIVQAAKRPIARLERTKCAEFLPEKTHEALLKERINEKMAVYKVPIEDSGTDSPISWNLTDDDLERMVSELPPLPQSPPWRATPTKRLANHILVITMIIVSLLGIGIAAMRMVIGGVSFSAVFQVLFFISWMFFFARLWIKR